MRWIEMIRSEVSLGEEEGLIRSVQAMIQPAFEAPVVAAMLWRNTALVSDFCVIIYCEDASEQDVIQIRSHLGHRLSKVMRSSGLVNTEVWSELKFKIRTMEVPQCP